MTMATIENIFSLNDTVFDARHEEYAEEETSIGVSKDVEEHFKGIMDSCSIYCGYGLILHRNCINKAT